MGTAITTGIVRLSYAHIFEPAADLSGNIKYQATLLVPKSDTKTIKAVEDAIEEAKQLGKDSKFGGKIPPKLTIAFVDGDGVRPTDGEPYGEECHDHYIITAKANENRPPLVVDKNLQRILDQTAVYSGCYVRANINFYAYNSNGNKGVACGLNGIQFVRDGEPLGGVQITAAGAFGDGFVFEEDDSVDDIL